ncbi:MAG TPA: hypothetical protein VF553_18940 [Pyrinomonadaceae bacterium]|jgi:hypothetical protein
MSIMARGARILLLAILCSTAIVLPVSGAIHLQAASYSSTDVLRAGRTIFIQTKTIYFKPATLEDALLRREEFQQWGLAITREEADADLIIEVDRKLFTNSFVYSVIDARTNRIVASGKVNSLGGTLERKISDSFIKRMRQARASSSPARTK